MTAGNAAGTPEAKAWEYLDLREGRLVTKDGRLVKRAPDRVRELIGKAFVGKHVEVRIEGGSTFFLGRASAVAINFTARSLAAGLVIDRPGRATAWLSLAQITSIQEVPGAG